MIAPARFPTRLPSPHRPAVAALLRLSLGVVVGAALISPWAARAQTAAVTTGDSVSTPAAVPPVPAVPVTSVAPAVPARPIVAASGAKPAPAKPINVGPAWTELSPAQQQALKPLTATWHTISEPQKRKWLEVSKNYPSLSPEGQATLHSRMNEWVTLSPQQRSQARLNFAKTKELSRQLTPEEKKAKWQTYQALSPEEKQKLAAKATPRHTGAATAVKPVAPQKLAAVPASPTKAASKPGLKMAPSSPAQAASAPVPAAGVGVTGGTGPAPQR